MLTIRNAQLECFATQHRTAFVEQMLSHLAASYPSWYEEQQVEGVRAFVHRVINEGDGHGLRAQSAVATLTELFVEFGETFERSPERDWARSIIAHPALPERLKISMLADRLRARTGGRRVVEIEASDIARR